MVKLFTLLLKISLLVQILKNSILIIILFLVKINDINKDC